MTPGRIVVDRVSQRFRVSTHPQRTLKDLFVARGRPDDARGLGAARRLARRRARRGGRARRAQRLGQDDAAASSSRGIFRPTSGRIEAGGRVASLLELGAGFHQDFTGRENVYLNGSIHGLSRARVRELMDEIVAFAELERFIDLPVRTYSSGMYMRLGFSVASHIEADVLLLDEVFAVGDEEFQRKCFGKIAEFKQRGGTIVFVSHDAQAVERLCDRAVLLQGRARSRSTGSTRDAIARYRRLLAEDRSPDELAAGLREWGSGEARVVSARLLDADGDERRQFAAGEPLVGASCASRPSRASPRRALSLELRDDDGVVLGGGHGRDRRARLGRGARASASCASSSTGCRSPRAASTCAARSLDGDGGRLLHSLDDARAVLRPPDRRRERRRAARRAAGRCRRSAPPRQSPTSR